MNLNKKKKYSNINLEAQVTEEPGLKKALKKAKHADAPRERQVDEKDRLDSYSDHLIKLDEKAVLLQKTIDDLHSLISLYNMRFEDQIIRSS
jgi:hypothetical protein